MAKLTKKPLQIYLNPVQDQVLRGLARRRGSSLGALIRESVQRYLEEAIPLEEDPAMGLIALGRSGKGDLSRDHDRHLAVLEKDSNR